MRSSRQRGVLARAVITLVLFGLLFVGLPVGAPVTGGGWPDPGFGRLWNAVVGSFATESASAEEAAVVRAAPVAKPVAKPAPPKRVRELPGKRAASAKVFEMSDGTFEADVFTKPVHYRDAQGAWRDIDTTVREQARDGFALVSERNQFTSRFGRSTENVARFELGGRRVSLGVVGEKRALTPKVAGNTVTYPDAVDDADLVYEVTPEALKEKIVLSARPAEATFEFTMRMAGVFARERADGAIAFFDKKVPDGPPVFVMPAPFMNDSADDPKAPFGKTYSDKVTQSVEQTGANFTVTVTADERWLAAPERKYPVVIDPTIKVEPTPTAGKDAQIWSDTPDTNFGGDYRLSVGADPYGYARALMRFDTSFVPAGTALTSADLRLYYDNHLHTDANDVTMQAFRVTADWLEDTVTWNTINTNFATASLTTQVKPANLANRWHEFDVTNIAQLWVSGSVPNYGFTVRAPNVPIGNGGAVYQAAEYAYGGGVANRPKLVLSYGRDSVHLAPITKTYSTGAVLNWPAYSDGDPNSTADDVVEYQVHRHPSGQVFEPTEQTLIAPLPRGARTFTDSTARPWPADSPELFGDAYYYMIAAKTRDGEIVAGPTQLARLPKAGMVTEVLQQEPPATTLSSAKPTTNLNYFDGQRWLSAGIGSSTYGTTRPIVKFNGLEQIPANARVVDAEFGLWGFYSWNIGAKVNVHPLTRSFTETEATWNRASSATAWINPGGDYSGTIEDQLTTITNDPRWVRWNVKNLVQSWVNGSATNHGLLVRLNDTTVEQRVLFNSDAAWEPLHRPKLTVTYTEPTAANTYYVPDTPSVRMIPGDEYTIPVTLTNTTTTTWTAADYKLSYRWTLPDGTDATTGGNRLETALGKDIPPLSTVTVQAKVKTPIQSAAGNKREQFVLNWDLRNTTTSTWLSATSGGVPALPQPVTVEDPTSDQLGLEKFYSYAGAPTGAGSNVLVNTYAGNTVWSYDAFSNPGRGLSTFLRMTYNSMDTSSTSMGYGWSMAASGLVRLGGHLELHPKGQDYPSRITLPDGDGTSHYFTLNKNGSTDPAMWSYDKPAGVHLYVQRASGSDDARRWIFTKPDRTKFYFDSEGWLTAVADRNGNTQTYTYTQRKSNNQPRKFLAYVTDPAGRQSMTLDYYTSADTTNPKIIDNVKSVTDISGRVVRFTYTDKGLLDSLVDGYGKPEAKTFTFAYDATQGNKNVKLVKVIDPRGSATSPQGKGTDLTYFTAPEDPRDKWKLKTINDRLGDTTSFAYTDLDGSAGSRWGSTVTDAEGRTTSYEMDGYGRPDKSTNAKNETTTMAWDADNNVVALTEANGATSEWRFDPKTGYPTSIRDAEAVKNNTGATTLEYQSGLNGYTAELTGKTTPQGRTWAFGYDTNANLKTVTDPKGVATTTAGDYQTSYTYDAHGQLLTATDANDNATTYSDYHPAGYPKTTADALSNATVSVYDDRGQVTKVTDAKGKATTIDYDTFGRPGRLVAPKDQAAGKLITTPAPVYDRNDNVTTSTAPNGAVTTGVYDAADQLTASTLPKDNATDPERKTVFTYDKVGNLLTETQPLGVASSTAGDYTTTHGYDEIYQLITVTNAQDEKISYTYNQVGDLIAVVDPRKNATIDTADFTAKYTYDSSHRQLTVTDAEGNVTSSGYDLDGNSVSATDAEGNTTSYVLDERAMMAEVRVPHKTGVTRTTKFVYDQVGNQTKVITPRGVDTGEANDFTHQTVFDKLNRPVERWSPYDPADARYNSPDKTLFSYDAVGNLAKTSAPPSEGQTVRNDTSYSYFDNGWARTSTDPWDIVTGYDYNDLGAQTSRALTSAGGTKRVMSWAYYPDGKLRARSDDGVPVGAHVAMVDNSDTGNVKTVGTWDSSTTGSGFQGYDYRTAAAGAGTSTFTWTPVIPADGSYEVFVKYPSGVSGAASDAKYTVNDGTLLTVKTVDQTSGGGTWKSLGSYSLKEGNKASVELSDLATGTVLADGVKLVRDTTGTVDAESKSFEYSYDLNGNLTSLIDSKPAESNARVDAYAMTYDGLNQLSAVVEKLAGSVRNTTAFGYDPNGNPVSRDHDTQDAVFEYDPRDLVSTVTNTQTGRSPKTTSYGYTKRGLLASEVKPNGNTVTYGYNLDGALASQVEKTTGGGLVAQHLLEYNANGHRVSDASKVRNADDPSKYLDEVREYGYDPRDRIAKVTKKAAASGSVLETESYTHDANANVVNQTVDGATTSFSYDRDRLLTAASGGSSAAYNYDPFGRLDSVTSAGKVIESYTYDGFDRTVEHKKVNDAGALESTGYAYDPLDRTAAKTVGGKTTDFQYLGLSDKVVTEELAGTLTKSYTYSAWGQRLSQVKHDQATPEESYYGYNPHTDVETLTGSDGGTKSTYGYTAYGTDDEQAFTGVDKPGAADPGAEPYNVYRYQGKRWDPNSESYDMGFRDYNPGLNRFLTRDMYNGALADLGLDVDPWTGNRYAFTGGNPISRIDIDGHMPDWAYPFFGGDDTLAVVDGSDAVKTEVDWSAVGDFFGGVGAEVVDFAEVAVPLQTLAMNSVGHDASDSYAGWVDSIGVDRDSDAYAGGKATAFVGSLAVGGGVTGAAKGVAAAAKAVGGAVKSGLSGLKNAASDVGNLLGRLAGKACSFTGETQVLMADGSQKPISEVEVGDQVHATDPETGERARKTVTHVFVHEDTVIDLEVDGGVITTTEDHPFWNATDHEWQRADALDGGDHVLTAEGRTLRVGGLRLATSRTDTAYNLEIADIHTYHVGDDRVLVHNACGFVVPKIAAKGLDHSFDRHASQWFGRDVSKSTHMGQWRELIERGAASKKVVPWSTGGTLTNSHLSRIDGKWLAVQTDRSTGELVTAFVPNGSQLSQMLRRLGK